MREIAASDLESRLLGDVERGETIVITRHGRPIARLVPEDGKRREETAKVFAERDERRKTMPRLTLDEILSGHHEGHEY